MDHGNYNFEKTHSRNMTPERNDKRRKSEVIKLDYQVENHNYFSISNNKISTSNTEIS